MNKRFRCVIAGWLLLMLCACTGGTDEPHIRYYRLASGQSENYLANQACQRFCDMVRKETDGAIQILPSFDNELGTDASALEQCVYGGIDFVRTPISSAAAYAPQLAALQLPYEYTSDKHLFRVLDGAVGQQVMASLKDKGLTGLSYFYAGYRCFFTTGKAITSLDDMKDLRLGTEDSSQMKQVIPMWGAEVVTLPPDEIALALRTDRIDGAESTLPTYVATISLHRTGRMTDIPTTRMCWSRPRKRGKRSHRRSRPSLSDAPLRRLRGSATTGRAQRFEQCCMHPAAAVTWRCSMRSRPKSSVQRCSRFTNTFPMRRRRSCRPYRHWPTAISENPSLCMTSLFANVRKTAFSIEENEQGG